MNRDPLPPLAKRGGTMLEKKLISYLEWRKKYRFEWRIPDMLNFDPTMMPPLIGDFQFVPLFELGIRLFMFENKIDRQRAVEFYYSVQKKPRRERKPRARRTRKRK